MASLHIAASLAVWLTMLARHFDLATSSDARERRVDFTGAASSSVFLIWFTTKVFKSL